MMLDQCSHLLANQDKIRLQLWCLLLVRSLSEVPTSHPEGLLCCRASSNSDKWSGARRPRSGAQRPPGAWRPRRNRRAGAPSGTPGWPGWRGSSYYYSQQQQQFGFGFGFHPNINMVKKSLNKTVKFYCPMAMVIINLDGQCPMDIVHLGWLYVQHTVSMFNIIKMKILK